MCPKAGYTHVDFHDTQKKHALSILVVGKVYLIGSDNLKKKNHYIV